jgi:hypothetical protein
LEFVGAARVSGRLSGAPSINAFDSEYQLFTLAAAQQAL